MSAETVLRRAAALMRERATANIVTPGPWGFAGVDGQGFAVHRGEHDTVALYANRPDAEHIASWHPGVALAVANLLDEAANGIEVMAPLDWDYPMGPMDCTGSLRPEFTHALTVARVYLGEA